MIAYLTHDEVNAALARRLAERRDLILMVIPVKDAELAAAAEVVILDLDHLPAEFKRELFERIGVRKFRHNLAVHSYNLSDSEKTALLAAGVRVVRRLSAALLMTSMSWMTPA